MKTEPITQTKTLPCLGERFIGCGANSETVLQLTGTPGNALGAYLNGGKISVHGNVQDAVGDTMNDGEINVHGSAGDALGYAMRGGGIFVRDHVGYRAGVHMKACGAKQPVLVIGKNAGSFLGEYLAGGRIILLRVGYEYTLLPDYIATGMHGGEIWVRSAVTPQNIPPYLLCKQEAPDAIAAVLHEFCARFCIAEKELYDSPFYCLRPNPDHPYKKVYVENI